MPRPKLTKPKFRLVMVKTAKQWAVSWTDPETGKTKRKLTGTDDHGEASLKMPGIIRELQSPKGPDFMIGELLDAYSETLKAKESSLHGLKPLHQFFADYRANQLNDATWNAYRAWRTSQMVNNATRVKNKPVSDSTAVRELRNMNAALEFGRRNGWHGLENKKVRIVNAPNNPRQDYLDRNEVTALLRACTQPHQRLYIRIALATAARMSAILELKWQNVTWPKDLYAVDITEMPEVYDDATGSSTGGIDFDLEMATALRFDLGAGRGNKKRGLGLVGLRNMNLYDELVLAEKYRKSDFVIEWNGKPLKQMHLEDVYRRAGLGDRRAKNHILKHTAITHLVMAGESYEDIAKLTGTSAQIIENTYGHHNPELLARVGSALSF